MAGHRTDFQSGILVDPRGAPAAQPVAPARRLDGLDGRRVLLVDNGKLGFGSYRVIVDTLRDGLLDAAFMQSAVNLLAAGDAEVDALADDVIASHRPDACILALADAGVTAHTMLLAIALERRGIPTVVVGTTLGSGLARAILRDRTDGLDMITLDVSRGDSADKIASMLRQKIDDIRSALTQDPVRSIAGREGLFPDDRQQAWMAAADAIASFQDWASAAGIGDGLPLVPPTEQAVAAHLAMVAMDADAILYGPALTSGRMLRVRDVAANAVMAGCEPRAFPVVLAALRAMAQPEYRLSQAAITTHPSGNAIILAGADPEVFGLTSGPGCLGPGHRGNACVGRAVSLTVLHLFGARPGEADLTTFGSSAEFTYCMAESCTDNPWPSLATELGDGRAGVFVLKAEAPRTMLENLVATPEALCAALADAAVSLCSNNSFVPGDLLVLLNPEHAAAFAAAGWSREDLATAIHHRACVSRDRVAGRGVGPIRPRYMDALDWLPVTRSPADVHIVVAGAAGPQSMVALPWGYSRGQWQAL